MSKNQNHNSFEETLALMKDTGEFYKNNRELAKAKGVHYTTVSQWLKNKTYIALPRKGGRIKVTALYKMCEKLLFPSI
jgi:hypothetical protein